MVGGRRYVEVRLPDVTQSTGVWAVIEEVLRRCELVMSRDACAAEV